MSKPLTWKQRADKCIAQGALTNSKRPSCLIDGVYPTHVKKGDGGHLVDTDNKRYIDYICGLGSNLMGYANPHIANAMIDQIRNGATYSLSSTLEVEAAEKIKAIFPFVHQMKFLKTGSDACSAAIKIARAHTKRKLVLSDGYHGWHDDFVSLSEPALGVVKGDRQIRKLQAIDDDFTNVAAIIIEPVILDWSKERQKYLIKLVRKAQKDGAVVIFDEVITGFRFPKFCVASHFGVTPDLICLGKAVGGGMPIGIVGGKEDVMSCGEYFVSSTFAGETVSLAAAIKTMDLLTTKKYDLDILWEKGQLFLERFNALWREKIWIEGYPTRGAFQGDKEIKDLFWQECCKAGILFGPSWFFNFDHIKVMDETLSTCRDVLARIKTGGVKLEGNPSSTPFAQKMREKQ